MSEKAVMKQLNKAKGAACKILSDAGYEIERASNRAFCLTASRETEWRIVAIGTIAISKCQWFTDQIKRLERYPCPGPHIIKKEVWIRGESEHAFKKFTWKESRWIDENQESVKIYS